MNAPLSAGAIGISVSLAGGIACAVEVRSGRPQPLSRLFEGRAPDEAAKLAGQIFSLCGFSQATAARFAVMRAKGCVPTAEERLSAAAGLLAERIFETLRSLAMQWPGKVPPLVQAASGLHLRTAMKASRAIVAEAGAGSVTTGALVAPVEALRLACVGVGVGSDRESPASGNLIDAIFRDIERDEVFAARPVEALGAEDDEEVARLVAANETYAARPFLPNRIMETGAYARHRAALPDPHSKTLAARLQARLQDLAAALCDLGRLSAGSEIAVEALMTEGVADGCGFAAVECARGRLYHLARIGDDGRMARYRILAPTEWNFHPAGPFVETLLSSRIGMGEVARARIAKLAALFDPCVAFDIELKEIGHA